MHSDAEDSGEDDEAEDDGEDDEADDDSEDDQDDSGEEDQYEDEDDQQELDGLEPTPKRRKLANSRALKLSLNTGFYPEYEGRQHQGATNPMDPGRHSALDYLKLFWTSPLIDVIVEETNRYARDQNRQGWKDVNADEVWTFLGTILEMGIVKEPRIENYWSHDPLLGSPVIPKHISLRRFWSIWSSLHVVDNSTLSPGDGLSAKIKPVLNILEDTFFINYSPGQELCVDEAMVKYKGKVKKGRVKMPKKPIKNGFKIWCCCDSSNGYLCSFQVYEGRPTNPITGKKISEKGLTMRVVRDLLSPFRGLNHVVYLDNFFTSVPLVKALRKWKIFTAGTIQRRSAEFPKGLKQVQPPLGSYDCESVDGTSFYVFHDRTLVSFVSNAHPLTMEGKVARLPPNSRVLRYQKVPPVLPSYNKFMGAVDRLNQMRKTYGFDRKSRRYWIRTFMTFFDFAVINAYIMYKLNCKAFGIVRNKCKDQLDFRLELVRIILKESRMRRMSQSTLDSISISACHLVKVSDIGLSRGRCYHCVKSKREKVGHTSFGCSNCRVRLCKTTCFHEFHQ